MLNEELLSSCKSELLIEPMVGLEDCLSLTDGESFGAFLGEANYDIGKGMVAICETILQVCGEAL